MNNIENSKSHEPKMTARDKEVMMDMAKDTLWNSFDLLDNSIWNDIVLQKWNDSEAKQQSLQNIKDFLLDIYLKKSFYRESKSEHSTYLSDKSDKKDFIAKQNYYLQGRAMALSWVTQDRFQWIVKKIKENWIVDRLNWEIDSDFAILSDLGLIVNQYTTLNPDGPEFNDKYKLLKAWIQSNNKTYKDFYEKIKIWLWQEQASLFTKSLSSKTAFKNFLHSLPRTINRQKQALRNMQTDLVRD